jgi:hypothetical protein
MEQPGYEEYTELKPFWGWILIVLLGLSLIVWGLLAYRLVRDRPREWDFGALPDVPAESAASSVEPAGGAPVPRQLEPLPRSSPAGGRSAPPAPSGRSQEEP